MKIFYASLHLSMALLITGCTLFSSEPPLVVAVGDVPESYHPHQVESLGEAFLAKNLYETLVQRGGRSNAVTPGLAESWSHDDEYLVFTFTLRENARWSDGSPVTATDVRESWLALLDPALEAPNAWYPSRFIAGAFEYGTGVGTAADVAITVVDDRTLSVELREPLSVFPAVLDHFSLAVVPREEGVFGGPFVLDSFDDAEVRLTRNRRYRGPQDVDVSQILMVSDPSAEDADWVLGAGLDDGAGQLYGAEADTQALTALALPLPALDYLLFNTLSEPFRDPALRRALSLAIDTEALVEELFSAPGLAPAVPAEKPTDREEARRLLSAAGLGSPEAVPTLELLVNDRPEHRRMAEAVAGQWREVLEIETRILQEEWPTYLRLRDLGTFEVARGGWLGYYADDAAILEAFTSDALANDGAYRSTRFDELLAAGNRLDPGEERQRLLGEARNLLVEEDAAIVPLFHRREVDFVNTEMWSGWEDPLRGRFSVAYLRRR